MIKLFFSDVDGTLTDGKINITENGELFKSFSVKDGYALKMLMNKGVTPIIITGRHSKIIEYRCKELGIDQIYQNVEDKKEVIEKISKEYGVTREEIAYIGDDENDIEAMKYSYISFAPNDALDKTKQVASVVLSRKGGDACIREAIDVLIDKELI